MADPVAERLVVGPYALFTPLASGGMGTVYFARMTDASSVVRPVAIKRLHPHLRREETFSVMLLDEAHLAQSVHHPNVVEVLDVVSTNDELLLVMEYVAGLSLHEILSRSPTLPVPLDVAITIVVEALHGLQAAHDAVGPDGRPLNLIHRDVSPQNLLVGATGTTKLTDFGVAKAVGRLRSTRDGAIRGKIAYMSPEQVADKSLDARSDVYAAAVVLWEMVVGRPMFEAESDVALFGKAMRGPTQRAAELVPDLPEAIDAAIWRALSRDPRRRFPTAIAFADALVAAMGHIDPARVAVWVSERARPVLEERESIVEAMLGENEEEATLLDLERRRQQEDTLARPEPPVRKEETFSDKTEEYVTGPHPIALPPAAYAPVRPQPILLAGPLPLLAPAPYARMGPAPTVLTPRPADRRLWIGLLIAAAAAILGTVLIVLAVRRHSPVADLKADPVPLSSASAPVTEALPSSSSSAHPLASAAPIASTAPTAPTAPTASTAPAKPHVVPPVKKHDPKADCTPPYSIDEEGNRKFKAWCVRP